MITGGSGIGGINITYTTSIHTILDSIKGQFLEARLGPVIRV